jgi:ketopantoate hydroxymethyltransferase
MEQRSQSVSEKWTVVGSIMFGTLCLVMSLVGQSLADELIEGQKTLVNTINETKKAMKDPNYYVLLITDNGFVSDSNALVQRLHNAESGIENVEAKTKDLTLRINFFQMLSMTLTSVTLMALVALILRRFTK